MFLSWCGTLSNALANSIIIPSLCIPPFARISCVKASIYVSVERFFSKSMLFVEENIVAFDVV